ncbi:MAG: DHH family phosphoesterase, partial [Burkholderiales bacterium]|nr:DHH family phosphoesterase [Burkholderiales bacterium]
MLRRAGTRTLCLRVGGRSARPRARAERGHAPRGAAVRCDGAARGGRRKRCRRGRARCIARAGRVRRCAGVDRGARRARAGLVRAAARGAARRPRRDDHAARAGGRPHAGSGDHAPGPALPVAAREAARGLRAMSAIRVRQVPQRPFHLLVQQGVHPLLSRLLVARGVQSKAELAYELGSLLPPGEMKNAEAAGELLADHVQSGRRILIVADYDCDGATACAVGVRGLRALGGRVDYLVPNRFETGYGLSPQVVELAAARSPDLIVTVDNGIASVEGVAAARELGIATLVTDHHLPGDALPDAACIVDPSQPGDRFPSKSIAGVGVMFYVLLAARAALRHRGAFAGRAEPNLAALLDLVALGTVADVVRLDRNNRVLVSQGLARIRAGRMQPGIAALFAVAGRNPRTASTFDLGHAIGPRLNAAGRLADMGLGIECLVTDDAARALNIARELDALNRERRELEVGMQRDADALLAAADPGEAASVCLYESHWHQGVVGLLASRLKDRLHRPVFAFAPAAGGELRGSGRSIPGLHLRDALDLVAKRAPGLLVRFGGHAAAAGLTLRPDA